MTAPVVPVRAQARPAQQPLGDPALAGRRARPAAARRGRRRRAAQPPAHRARLARDGARGRSGARAGGARHCERMITMNLDRETPARSRGRSTPSCTATCSSTSSIRCACCVALDRASRPTAFVMISVPNVAHLWIRLSLLVGPLRLSRPRDPRPARTCGSSRSARCARCSPTPASRSSASAATPAPLYQVLPVRWHGGVLAATHAIERGDRPDGPRLLGYQFVVLARSGPRAAGRLMSVTRPRPRSSS